MTESVDLSKFVPVGVNLELNLHPEYSNVVGNLLTVLTPDEVWDLYSLQIKNKVHFPWFKFDRVLGVEADIQRLNNTEVRQREGDWEEIYDEMARKAFYTVVGIEVGFGGFDKFAESPASKSWIWVTDNAYVLAQGGASNEEERLQLVREKKASYNKMISLFAQFRVLHGGQDFFGEKNLDRLLFPFMNKFS